jgi:hypothetical protein
VAMDDEYRANVLSAPSTYRYNLVMLYLRDFKVCYENLEGLKRNQNNIERTI